MCVIFSSFSFPLRDALKVKAVLLTHESLEQRTHCRDAVNRCEARKEKARSEEE